MNNTTAVECRECDGTGEGFGRPCGGCRGRGERIVSVQHDGSLFAMEAEVEAVEAPALPAEGAWVPPCCLCGDDGFVHTFEPVIVDSAQDVFRAELRTHRSVLRHSRRVIPSGRPLCKSCLEVISYLPAVNAMSEAA
jgi:hypothetical protein